MLQLLHLVINYVGAHWSAIASLFGGGVGLSVGLEFVLHKLHIDSKRLAYILLHAFALAASLAAFYLGNANVLPAYAGLAIAAQTVHRFAVSPWYTKYIQPYLTYLSEQDSTKASPAQSQAGSPSAQAPTTPSFVS